MADPAAVLRPALRAYLKAKAGVITSFGSKTVKVFDKIPPPNSGMPYIWIAGLFVDDALADCMDNAEVDLQVDVWSLTDPPAFTEAETIGAAVKAAVAAIADNGDSPPPLSVSGWRVVAVEPLSTNYVTDESDAKTVHGILRFQISLDQVG